MPGSWSERWRLFGLAGRLARRLGLRRPRGRALTAAAPGRALEPIGEQDLAEIKRRFPLPKFFIYGHGRSGTTLLARLIRLHPDVHCEWQAHFFTKRGALADQLLNQGFLDWLQRPSNRWTAGQMLETPILRVLCDYVLERAADRVGKGIVGDKSPDASLEVAIPRLHCVYPDAKLIYIVRDGRDAVLSRRIQLFVDSPGQLSAQDLEVRRAYLRDRQPFMRGERSIFTPGWLEAAATHWDGNVRNTHALAQDLYGEAYLSLRYEDLIAEPLDRMRNLWAFLGASPTDPALEGAVLEEMGRNPAVAWQEQKAPGLVEGLQRGSQGGWRAMFTAEDRRLFERIAGDTLTAWGYELGA